MKGPLGPVRFQSDVSGEDNESYASIDYSERSSDSDSSISPRPSRRFGWRACKAKIGSDPNALAGAACFAWFINGLIVYTQRPWGADKEPYTIIESLYIMAQIITTVGYGDQCPVCPRGMLYTCFYILFAILVLSSLLTALTEHVLKRQQKVMESAIKTSFGIHASDAQGSKFGALNRRELDQSTADETSMNDVDLPQGWKNLLSHFVLWLLCVIVGALFMFLHPGELPDDEGGVKMIKAFYFSIITLTTVGFGDICPQTQEGKLFAAFWMLFGVTSFGLFVSSFSAVFMARRSSERLKAKDRHQILKMMDRDNDGKVGQAEFLAYMLHKHGIGDAVGVDSLCDIIQVITAEFKALDADDSGELEFTELSRFDDNFLVRHKSGIGDQLGLQQLH